MLLCGYIFSFLWIRVFSFSLLFKLDNNLKKFNLCFFFKSAFLGEKKQRVMEIDISKYNKSCHENCKQDTICA